MRQHSGRQGMAEVDAQSVVSAPGNPAEHLHERGDGEGHERTHAHAPLYDGSAAGSGEVCGDDFLCRGLVTLQDGAEPQAHSPLGALVETGNVPRF